MTATAYKIVEEWSAPRYLEVGTDKVLYESCEDSWQAYWVVSWDEEEQEIIEWVEVFSNIDQANKYLEELKGE